MPLYDVLKLVHVLCVAISGSLFLYRYGCLIRYPREPLVKPLRVLPHVNDTVLLAAAIGMLLAAGLNPFLIPWLLAKIVALLLYVFTGALCLKAEAGSARQTVLFLMAISAFSYIVLVATAKQAWPL